MPADRCAACGRRLRRESPSGLGPVCARRLGVPADRPSARRTIRRATTSRSDTAAPQVPGQTEIDLHYHQPTLESL